MCEKLNKAKNNVLTEISKNKGVLTDNQFDNIFERKRGCGKLIFTPMWFICANIDKNLAFHIHAAHELMKENTINHKNNAYTLI